MAYIETERTKNARIVEEIGKSVRLMSPVIQLLTPMTGAALDLYGDLCATAIAALGKHRKIGSIENEAVFFKDALQRIDSISFSLQDALSYTASDSDLNIKIMSYK